MIQPQHDYYSFRTYLVTSICCLCLFLPYTKPFSVQGKVSIVFLGSVSLVIFNIISSEQAFLSLRGCTLLLYVSSIIILNKLKEKGLKKTLRRFLLWGSQSTVFFLVKVSLVSGLLGALILNAGTLTIVSELVFSICNDHGLHLYPFGLAITTSANIGSVATILGSPLNMIVYETVHKFTFVEYAMIMSFVTIIGLCLNIICLCWFYYHHMEISDISQICRSVDYRSLVSEYTKISQGIEPQHQSKELIVSIVHPKTYGAIESDYLLSYDSLEYQQHEESPEIMQQDGPGSVPIYCSNFSTSPESISPIQLFPNTPPTTPRINMDSSRFIWPSHQTLSKKSTDNSGSSDSSIQMPPTELQLPASISMSRPCPVPKLMIPIRQPSTGTSVFYGANISTVSCHSNRLPRSPRSYGRTRISLCQKAMSGIHGFWKSHTGSIILSILLAVMYFVIVLGLNPAWACFTVALLIVLVDGNISSVSLSHANWLFLGYLCAVFVLSRGLLATPIPADIWASVEPLLHIEKWDIYFVSWVFCLVVMIPNIIIGSYPTLLLVLPFLQEISDSAVSLKLTLVLLWCAILCGNLTPYENITSAIVTDVYKQYYVDKTLVARNRVVRMDRANARLERLYVWIGYTSWTTFLLIMIGVPLIVYNVDQLV